MRLITLFFSVAFLALAVWVWSSPGFALTVPVSSTKTGLMVADGFAGMSEKVIQITGRKRRVVTAEERRAAKAWAKAKRKRGKGSASGISPETMRRLDELLLLDAIRGAGR
jgi:hypothetical protein